MDKENNELPECLRGRYDATYNCLTKPLNREHVLYLEATHLAEAFNRFLETEAPLFAPTREARAKEVYIKVAERVYRRWKALEATDAWKAFGMQSEKVVNYRKANNIKVSYADAPEFDSKRFLQVGRNEFIKHVCWS